MVKVVKFNKPGGPDVLVFEDVTVGAPGPGAARIKHTVIGVNYIDTYHRSGLYPLPLPSGLGLEGVGIVEAVGPGVAHIKPGDKVAYAGGPPGGYSEARLIPADRLVTVPAGLDDKTVGAMMLRGMTAQFLLKRCYPVKAGQTILIHAAAGGVGLIVCQWAKALGCTVIGTVGSDAKADIAQAHGCDYPIVYTRENFTERVRALTKGEGVPVVYDSVGKDTLDGSLDCLQPMGMMVLFGNASGMTAPLNIGTLAAKGSLFLTRPTLMTYIAKRADLEKSAADLFDIVRSGKVKISVNQTYAMKDVVQMHRDMEARKTTGSTIMLP